MQKIIVTNLLNISFLRDIKTVMLNSIDMILNIQIINLEKRI